MSQHHETMIYRNPVEKMAKDRLRFLPQVLSDTNNKIATNKYCSKPHNTTHVGGYSVHGEIAGVEKSESKGDFGTTRGDHGHVVAGGDDSTISGHTLLQGPCSCGKTSLAMDFSLHLADMMTAAAAVSKDRTAVSANAQEGSKSVVWYVMPTSSKEDTWFPLPCRSIEENSFFQGSACTQWKEQDYSSLEKIKIKYFDSIADLIFALATIDSLPRSEQPSKAIIIDDLDVFLQPRRGSQDEDVCVGKEGTVGTNEVMKLIQLCTLKIILLTHCMHATLDSYDNVFTFFM